MIGLLVTGSHGFVSSSSLQRPARAFWRRLVDWLRGR